MSPRLREADKIECDAALGVPPLVALSAAVQSGHRAWTFCPDSGEPVGMFGVTASPVPQVGIVWMCSTPAIHTHAFEFLIGAPPIVDAMNEEFPVLTNLVDARNTLHHKWLRRMGFSFLRKLEKWGARSVPFYEFARLQNTCASH